MPTAARVSEIFSHHCGTLTNVIWTVAIRIIRTAQELGWSTVAIYTAQDTSHATFADEAVKLDDVSWFMNPERIVDIAMKYERCLHSSHILMNVADHLSSNSELKAHIYTQATASSVRASPSRPSSPRHLGRTSPSSAQHPTLCASRGTRCSPVTWLWLKVSRLHAARM